MKVLYKQGENSVFEELGVKKCFLKKLCFKQDRKNVSDKKHHHQGYEIHIIRSGFQTYEINDEIYTVNKNEMLLIPPFVLHKAIDNALNTEKIAISFEFEEINLINPFVKKITNRTSENICFILNEYSNKQPLAYKLIENSLFEIIVSVFRPFGINKSDGINDFICNTTVLLAMQYISDNIENALTVNEVARYCNLSQKQLTRIFYDFCETTPGEYIRKLRINRIEELLNDGNLSIRGISEKMNFSNEYYFNSFVKTNIGMPPGEYRKMLGK